MIPQTKIEVSLDNFLEFKQGEVSDEEVIQWEVKDVKDAFTAGVRFAESEMGKSQTFEIEFACHVKTKIEFKDGELTLISAVDVWGEALDPDQIIITKPNHENES